MPTNKKKRPTYRESTALQTQRKKLNAWESAKPGAYSGKYTEELDALLNKSLARPAFRYNVAADPLYRQLRERAVRQGRLAMEDTVGSAAALTGGYANSYAVTAGSAAYQRYLDGLNDAALQLYDRALAAYRAEGDDLKENTRLLRSLDNDDYRRYRDRLADYYDEGDYLLRRLSDMSDDEYKQFLQTAEAWETDRAFDRGVYEDERDYKRRAYEDDRDYERGVYESDRSYKRRTYEDDRDYKRRVAENDRDYKRRVAEDERDYKRGVAEDERDYNRGVYENDRDYAFRVSEAERDKREKERSYALAAQKAAASGSRSSSSSGTSSSRNSGSGKSSASGQKVYKPSARYPTSYSEFCRMTGYAGIMTPVQFGASSARERYRDYQSYLNAMYRKYA